MRASKVIDAALFSDLEVSEQPLNYFNEQPVAPSMPPARSSVFRPSAEQFKVQRSPFETRRGRRSSGRTVEDPEPCPEQGRRIGTRNAEQRRNGAKQFSYFAHLLATAIVVFAIGCGKSDPPKPRPPDVEVVRVEQKDVPIWKDWIGTLEGLVNAQIKAQVTGYLLRQTYKDGSFVKKDQLLFEIDPRTFQAAVDQAKGQLASVEGQLAQAQANQIKAQNDVARYTPLAKEQAIPQQDLDNAIQANKASLAQVSAAKAQVEAAKAQVASAQLNLGFTRVVSLVDGIAGIAQAQIGDLVTQSSLLTTVSTVDPIKIYFPISEREYLDYVKEHPDEDKRHLGLQMVLANGSVYPHEGKTTLVDRQVEVKTGTLRVQGVFPNPGNVLRPGEYAHIRTIIATRKGALVVPQKAVSELQGNYQVAVVGSDNKVQIRPVKVGERIGTDWIIAEGLKPGERVVAEGVQKVRGGMAVNPKPLTATAKAQPAPAAPTR